MTETTTNLSEKAINARREYKRQWRAKNRDKVRQYDKNYWERKALEKEK